MIVSRIHSTKKLLSVFVIVTFRLFEAGRAFVLDRSRLLSSARPMRSFDFASPSGWDDFYKHKQSGTDTPVGSSVSTTTTTTTTTTANPSLWSVVDGSNRACRGATSSDNSASYYELRSGVASLDSCKALCLEKNGCIGIEYSSASRCELWTREIDASTSVSGYTCLRYGSTPSPTPTPLPIEGFEVVDGGSNRACRGATPSDNSASNYELHTGTASLESCKALCAALASCKAIEYGGGSRCELWTREVTASSPVSGYTCMRYVGDGGAGPTPAPVVTPAPVPMPVPVPPAVDGTWVTGTWTTGYWDCCKPSCSWSGKGQVSQPTLSCDITTGQTLVDADATSVCEGGNAASCASNRPFVINSGLSMGFAAAAVSGNHGLTGDDNCGQCYELRFTDERHPNGNWGGSHPSLVNKTMVVQITNIGYDVSGEHSFDLQIPGAGQGAFTQGCQAQYPGFSTGDFDCDNNYGGCSEKSGCARLPSELRAGCEWRYDWYYWLMAGGQTNNPYVSFRRVQCPSELTAISGSVANDDAAFPAINAASYM